MRAVLGCYVTRRLHPAFLPGHLPVCIFFHLVLVIFGAKSSKKIASVDMHFKFASPLACQPSKLPTRSSLDLLLFNPSAVFCHFLLSLVFLVVENCNALRKKILFKKQNSRKGLNPPNECVLA